MSISVTRNREAESFLRNDAEPALKGISSLALFSAAANGCDTLISATRETSSREPGQKSLFKAAGTLFKVRAETNKTFETQLENEMTVMQAQLKSLEGIVRFWEKVFPIWQKFQNDSSNHDLFKELIQVLKEEFANDPTKQNELKNLESKGDSAYNKEQYWQSHGWLYHLFHGEWLSDPDLYNKAMGDIKPILEKLTKTNLSNNPLFQGLFDINQKNFQTRIQRLFLTIRVLREIATILEHSQGSAKEAIFHMEALLMALQQLQINGNTEKSEEQQSISQANEKSLEANLSKIEESLKKLSESHSEGLWGLFKNFFEGIYYGLTGKTEKAKHCFEKVGEIAKVFDLVKDLACALGKLIQSAALASVGDIEGAKVSLEEAKNYGEKILANPAFRLVADIAMAAIIIASVMTGQIAVALIMVVLFIASQTGALQKGTEAIAKGLTDAGVDAKWSKVIANVIVIVAITVASAGAGALQAGLSSGASAAGTAAAEAAASVGARTAAGVAAESALATGARSAARAAVEEGAEAAAQSAKTTGTSSAIAKQAASLGAYGLGSSLGSSTLVLDILDAVHKKDNQALAIFLQILQVIAAAVTASIGAVTAVSQSMPQSLTLMGNSSFNFAQMGSKIAKAASIAGGVAGMANGGEKIFQGFTMQKLDEYKANVHLDETTQNLADAMIQQTSEELKQIVKLYESLISTAFKTTSEVANAELQALMHA